MNKECGIIKDLLPLYAENIASPETVEFIEEHLKTCEECRKEYEQMKESKAIEPKAIQADAVTAPLLKLRRKMRVKRIQTVAVTAMIVIALLVSTLAVLTSHEYIPYSEELLSITENDDKSVNVCFNEKVTDYSIDFSFDADGHKYCHISAWSSLWDKWFSGRKGEPFTANLAGVPFTIYYASNNGADDVCVYGEPMKGAAGIITQPRLTMGYYLIISAILFAILLVACFIVRRKENIRVWIERVMLYPLSYAIAHLLVLGFGFTTYSITRDFLLVILISLLLWCGMLLAHGALKNHKEIKEITQSIKE